MDIIYVDSLFFLNAVIDYFILLAAARLCPHPPRRGRLALGAVFGGLYAVFSVLPALTPLRFAVFKLLCGIVMVFLAFGGQGRFIRSCAVFLAVSAAFGGAVWAVSLLLWGFHPKMPYISVSMPVLAVSFALCYGVITLSFRRIGARAERRIRSIEVCLGDKKARFPALEDTGNSLYEPISGQAVLTAEAEALLPLLPPDLALSGVPEADFSRLSAYAELQPRLRLIPYTALGTASGLLLAIRPDSLTADGEKASVGFVALSPTPISPDGEYRGVI